MDKLSSIGSVFTEHFLRKSPPTLSDHVFRISAKCACGAILLMDGQREVAAPSRKWCLEHGINVARTPRKVHEYCCCDRCVNHWSLDMCSCGSGELVGDCECGSSEPSARLSNNLPRD